MDANNKLEVFTNDEFGSVRTITIDNEPWFVGKDVCNAFGDKNHNRSIGRIDDEDKMENEIIDSLGRKQKAIFVNESGLYSLLFAMQPKKANTDGVSDAYPIEIRQRIEKLHKFKRWITSEVIPSIRKHGVYMTDNLLDAVIQNPEVMQQVIIKMNADRESNRQKMQQLESELKTALPKVMYFNKFVDPGFTTNLRDTAKEFEIPQKCFINLLIQYKFIFRTQKDELRPKARALEKGLFILRDYTSTINGHKGTYTLVTAKGKKLIYEYFVKKGIMQPEGGLCNDEKQV